MATNTFDPHGEDDLSIPPTTPPDPAEAGLASEMIRQKLNRIYAEEPAATQELAEAARSTGRSKHQQFMYNLGTSGKDLATIQTEWHHYYESLTDKDKHAVWREFYASQSSLTAKPGSSAAQHSPQALAKNKNQTRSRETAGSKATRLANTSSAAELQKAIRDKVTAGGKLQAKHHLQSLLFGLGLGMIVVIIFLFGFFNEVVIAPFIQPSRASAATPLIVSSNSVAHTSNPEVIIPKINVEIPVNYSETSTSEADIENDLESGVVHYPNTSVPGQTGNAAFFGHSSNNIFNKGKYKFAFVLLHTLQEGDLFYLTYNNKMYVYKVISRTIVDPSDVGVLGPVPGQQATATLITCDPPGTSLHRLIVVGKQISPDPSGNTAASNPTDTAAAAVLPGNGPTLWTRLIRTAAGKTIVVIIIAGGLAYSVWRLNRRLIVR